MSGSQNNGLAMSGAVAEGMPDARAVAGLQSTAEIRDVEMPAEGAGTLALQLDVRGKAHSTFYVNNTGADPMNMTLHWWVGIWDSFREVIVCPVGMTIVDRLHVANRVDVYLDGTEDEVAHVAAAATI